ncbi:hypothetical protein BVRB_2g042120 [Beta vulgaris subsp. vulgaris]|nr:hypothetical protein BVRB_2g042120 [Beta vulgaris subsp. vulgaris]
MNLIQIGPTHFKPEAIANMVAKQLAHGSLATILLTSKYLIDANNKQQKPKRRNRRIRNGDD